MCQRVLFVAACPPFANGGGSQATRAYMDAVFDLYGRKNVDVMLFEEASIPDSYLDINYIKVPHLSFFKHIVYFIKGYLSRLTLPLIHHLQVNKDDYKLCIINSGLVGGKALPYLRSLRIKTVVIHHNYEVEFQRDNKSIETLKGHYLGKVIRTERLSYRYADINLFLTMQDVSLFKEAYGKMDNCFVIGTFDYKDRQINELRITVKDYDLSVSGTLANYQTTVGLLDFNSKYLTIAKRLIPHLRILLTGRSPSQQILDLQKNDSITFTIIPNPADILSIVQRGRIYLCPTCIGGGLKLRAMDGLKSGMPVLVHEVSARGYDYFFGKPYFRVYNNEQSFENGLSSILSYLKKTTNSAEQINKDYYEYFGYNNGLERMAAALLVSKNQ